MAQQPIFRDWRHRPHAQRLIRCWRKRPSSMSTQLSTRIFDAPRPRRVVDQTHHLLKARWHSDGAHGVSKDLDHGAALKLQRCSSAGTRSHHLPSNPSLAIARRTPDHGRRAAGDLTRYATARASAQPDTPCRTAENALREGMIMEDAAPLRIAKSEVPVAPPASSLPTQADGILTSFRRAFIQTPMSKT